MTVNFPSVWVALDIPDRDQISAIISSLRQSGRSFGVKLGLEAIAAIGLPALRWCVPDGVPLFIDMKFKDIPNTVAGASRALQRYKPFMFNIHASGGGDMMQAAVKERGESAVFAVTVLTSFNEGGCYQSYGETVGDAVQTFASLASISGVQGLICSPQDLQYLTNPDYSSLLKLTPGIRPLWAAAPGDQKRVTTPAEAILAGADGIIVGRPVLNPPSPMTPADALRRVHDEARIVQLFRQYDGLLTGHFVLKSGRHSAQYLNKDVLFPHEEAMNEVATMLADMLDTPADIIIGPETGGAKLARAVAGKLGLLWASASKTEAGFEVSRQLVCDRRVLLTEDILTTGGSVLAVEREIEDKAGVVVGILGLINRGRVDIPGLQTLASLDVETWTPEECPPCQQRVPVNTNVGHGGRK